MSSPPANANLLLLFASPPSCCDARSYLSRKTTGCGIAVPGAETDPRRDIHVFVEVSPIQPRVAGGVFFVIDVGNEGSDPAELADITADGRIGLGVWNADGVPVDLPDHEGTTTSNPGGWARRHGLPEHVKAEMKERRPFAVMKPDLLPDDPKMKSIESIKDGKIRLEPGEHFQVQVLITKVLGEPEKWQAEMEKRSGKPPTGLPGPDPPKIARIDAGTYQFLARIIRTCPFLRLLGELTYVCATS